MFATPDALARLVAPWADYYSGSAYTPTVVTFLHLAPLVVGGGLAIATDRAALRVRLDDTAAARRHLAEVASVHPVVVGGLALSVLTGIGMLAADLDTFLPSWIFWLKMALIAALLANGAVMRHLERSMLVGDVPPAADRWRRLRGSAMTSLVLWLAITLAGVVLTNAA